MKDDYHIANSELIGDVFDDNDEVFCDIAVPMSKRESKQAKMKRKNGEEKGKNKGKEDNGEV